MCDFLSVNFGQREGCRLVTSASWDFYRVSVLSFKFITLFSFSLMFWERKKRAVAYIYIYISPSLSLSLSKSKNASSTNAYCKLHHIFRCFKERPTQWYTHFVKSFVTQLTPHGVSNDPLPYCNWFFFFNLQRKIVLSIFASK